MRHVAARTSVPNALRNAVPKFDSDPDFRSSYDSKLLISIVLTSLANREKIGVGFEFMRHVAARISVANALRNAIPKFDSDPDFRSSHDRKVLISSVLTSLAKREKIGVGFEFMRHVAARISVANALRNAVPQFDSDPDFRSSYDSKL